MVEGGPGRVVACGCVACVAGCVGVVRLAACAVLVPVFACCPLRARGSVLCVCFLLAAACLLLLVLLLVLGPSLVFLVFSVFSVVFSGFGFLWILRGLKKGSRTSSHGLNFFSPGFLVVSIPG